MLWTWISSPMPRSRPSAKLASWSLRRKCNVLKVGGRDNTCIYTPCYEYRFRMIPNNSSPYSWIPCHQKKIGIWNGTISINIWIWCPPKPASLWIWRQITMMAPPKGDPSSDVLGCFSRASQPTTTDTIGWIFTAIGGFNFWAFLGFIPLISVPVSSPWKDWFLYPYFCCLNLHP